MVSRNRDVYLFTPLSTALRRSLKKEEEDESKGTPGETSHPWGIIRGRMSGIGDRTGTSVDYGVNSTYTQIKS